MRKATRKSTKAISHDQSLKLFQGKVDKAWDKLRRDIQRRASPEVIRRDRDELTYLLGECDYLWHEYTRCWESCR